MATILRLALKFLRSYNINLTLKYNYKILRQKIN